MTKDSWGTLTTEDGESLDLEAETFATVLATFDGSVSAEEMEAFATALLSTQRGRQLLRRNRQQGARAELLEHFGEFLQSRTARRPLDEPDWDVVLSEEKPKHRRVAKLWYQGYSVNKIASETNYAVQTVDNLIHSKLRRDYGTDIIPRRRQQD